MAAVLSADIDDTDKVVTMVDECARMGLKILPPDVNASGYDFTVEGERAIRYGLGAVRGVGAQAVEALVAERDGQWSLHQPRSAVPAHRPGARQPARAGSTDQVRQPRRTGREPRDAGGRARCRRAGRRAGHARQRRGPGRPVRRRRRQRRRRCSLRSGANRCGLPASAKPWGCILTGHPIQRYETDLPRLVSARHPRSGQRARRRSQAKAAATTAAARSAPPD